MEFLALFCICLLLLIIFTVVRVHPQGSHISISQHAASEIWTYILFGISLSLLGGVFLIFMETSFASHLALPRIFSAVLFASWICLLVTAWIPDRGSGPSNKIHLLASYGMAILMTIIMGCLTITGNLNTVFRFITAFIACWYIFTLYLWFFVKSSHRHFLSYQVINIVSFFIIIFAIVFFNNY
jgi:hypothetical protein